MTAPRTIACLLVAALGMGLLSTQSGCSLLVSKKRQLARFITIWSAAANRKDWKAWGGQMTSDFKYVEHPNKAYMAGSASVTALHARLDGYKYTSFVLQVKETTQVTETKMVVKARLQAREALATNTINRFWEVSMTWVYIAGKWYVSEIKDLTAVTQANS